MEREGSPDSNEEVRVPPMKDAEKKERRLLASKQKEMASTSKRASQEDDEEASRAPRFSEEENELLVEGVLQYYDVLLGSLSQKTSHKTKMSIWRKINREINTVSVQPRSLDTCKKRFRDCKRITKEKMARVVRHVKGSGGGQPLHLTWKPWEELLRQHLSSTAVEGVEGSIDTLDPTTFPLRAPENAPSTNSIAGSSPAQGHTSDALQTREQSMKPLTERSAASQNTARKAINEGAAPAKKKQKKHLSDSSLHAHDDDTEGSSSPRLYDANVEDVPSQRDDVNSDYEQLGVSPARLPETQEVMDRFQPPSAGPQTQKRTNTSGQQPTCDQTTSSDDERPTPFDTLANFAKNMLEKQERHRQHTGSTLDGLQRSFDRLSEQICSSNKVKMELLQRLAAAQKTSAACQTRIAHSMEMLASYQQQTAASCQLIALSLQAWADEAKAKRRLIQDDLEEVDSDVSKDIPSR